LAASQFHFTAFHLPEEEAAALTILLPGATRSGTIGSALRSKRWLEEKSATLSFSSQAPTDSASE